MSCWGISSVQVLEYKDLQSYEFEAKEGFNFYGFLSTTEFNNQTK